VSLLINNKLNSAEIRIDPPHLGKLDIQIQLKDDSATISINTHNAQTRELIDSASVRLREFLQEAGYSSVDVNVSHREQSMAQGDLSDQDQQSDSNDQQQSSDQSELAAAHQAELSLMIDDGRIDYFA
jgi:flagellar hook-length control protein FliK